MQLKQLLETSICKYRRGGIQVLQHFEGFFTLLSPVYGFVLEALSPKIRGTMVVLQVITPYEPPIIMSEFQKTPYISYSFLTGEILIASVSTVSPNSQFRDYMS